MNKVDTLITVCRTIASILLVAGIFSTSVLAQSEGSISGRIIDEENGGPLRSATIQVIGQKFGAFSDVKGMYRIRKVPAGTYTLKVSFVGYQTKTIEKVVVTANKDTKLDISIGPERKELDEVVVTAVRSFDNATAVMAQRKNAAVVSDGISMQEMQKLPDSDAGQALKRVPGVTLVEGKFVYVRGASERYNNTTLNGATLTSTEPDKKSFAFDMFPSEFLQNASVSKSFTPDMPGNFAGGLVQLNTIDFPDQTTLKVSISTGFNDNVTLQDGSFLRFPGGGRDWLATDDGSRALPEGVPSTRREMDRLLNRAADPNDLAALREWNTLGRSFNDQVWQEERVAAPINQSYGLSYGQAFAVSDDSDFGVVANISYGQSFQNNNLQRGAILSDGNLFTDFDGIESSREVSIGGLLNLAYKFGGHSSITFKNIYNRSAEDNSVDMTGVELQQVQDRRLISNQFLQKELYSGQLGGEHTLPFENMLVDWKVGYSASNRDEPDFRRLRYDRSLGVEDEPFRASVPVTPLGAGNLAGRFFSTMDEAAWSGNLNITLPLGDVKIKAGGAFDRRDRDFTARSLTIIRATNILGENEFFFNQELLELSPGELFRSENFNAEGFGMAEDSKLSDSYTAREELNAAYAMVDFPLEIAGQEFRIITGVRVEDNLQSINSFTVDDQESVTDLKTTDFLPALNILYRPMEDFNVRFSASQTLARPSLREFAPFAFYDFQQLARVQGNPNLNRSLIQNYDLRFEYFPGPGEVYSFSLFYKRFENAIEQTIIPANEIALTFSNADGVATNYGVEFEFRKDLGFLTSTLRNLIFSANLSLIASELTVAQGDFVETRAMWGQSPYSANVGLFYTLESTGTGINLAYNRAGRRIIQVALADRYVDANNQPLSNPHVYEEPRDVVDFSITQPITDMLEVKFAARDLLNQRLIWNQVGTQIASNLRGRTFSLSIGYRFL